MLAFVEIALVSVVGGLVVAFITAFSYLFVEFRKETVKTLEKIHSELAAQIAEIREVQIAHGQALTMLEERLAAVLMTLANHGQQLTEIRSLVAEHSERIARLEGAVHV